MKVIANVPILHGGRQYRPGDQIFDFDSEIAKLWLQYKSVHVERDTTEEKKEQTRGKSGKDAYPSGTNA